MHLPVVLTADDAPTIAAGGPVQADPGRLDRLREVLVAHGVPTCVAFVIGAHAEGHEDALERWLAAGYELGNHTHDHLPASRVDRGSWLESVRRCDGLLARVGAFARGRRRWFRYPFLDRGRDARARAEIAGALRDEGYEPLHATIDFFDHCYEAPLARALADGDARRAAAVGRRFERAALGSLRRARGIARRILGRDAVQVAFFHFGLAAEAGLGRILQGCRALGVAWRSAAEAIADPLHREYDADPERTGLVIGALSRSLFERAVSRAARAWHALDPSTARYGPAFPHAA